MVGAGNLITLMFGIPYEWAVIIVGVVMLAYVLFGGMIATTWVQIIKAVPAALRRDAARRVLVLARFHFRRATCSPRSRRGTGRRRSSRAGSSPIRSTRSRSGWR